MNLKHVSSAVSETPPPPIADAIDDGQMTSPAEIDARRAHGLLDRAQHLAERGDVPAALLACRQAIALAHESPEGYSMLGTLLERTGDLSSSQAAYTKALEFAPTSAADLESLKRLRVKMDAAASAVQVKFTEHDLLATDNLPERVETPIDSVMAPAVATAVVAHVPTLDEIESEAAALGETPALDLDARLPPSRAAAEEVAPIETAPVAAPDLTVAAAPIATAAVATAAVAAAAVAAPTPAAVPVQAIPDPPVPTPQTPKTSFIFGSIANDSSAEQRAADRRQLDLPIDPNRRTGDDRRLARALNAPVIFDPIDSPRSAPLWIQLVRSPSFFGRTLPLVAVTVLSLGFLGWARGRAISQLPPQNPGVVAPGDPTDPEPQVDNLTTQPGSKPPTTTVALPTAAPGGGFPISNVPAVAMPAQQAPATSTSITGGARAATTHPHGGRVGTTRPVPNFPASLPPAAIIPGAIKPAGANGAAGLGIPSPQINQGTVSAPITVLPPTDSAPGVGANPLNPAGSGRRGYIRIQQGKLGNGGDAPLPQRPANQANSDEQQAAAAARNGQSDQAIGRLNNAINSGNSDPNDMGFRLQQRANLFLERNDYTRAADDFQSAITAYQDQIDRGQNVSSARAGLKAARSGLTLALAGQRGG